MTLAAITPALHRRRPALLAASTVAVYAAGVALRWPLVTYHGPREQWALNAVLFEHPGAYSDVASLFMRDALWTHPAPYFVRPVEYPVLLGALIWAINAFARTLVGYTLLTALVMAASGLATVWLTRRFREANPWLLALAPAGALYVLLNWDMAAALPMILALWLYRQGRDVRATLALSLAAWIKFFPLLVLPVVLADRVARGRYRDALRSAALFVGVSVLVNAPFARMRGPTGAWTWRPAWTLFFRYNRIRASEMSLWDTVAVLHPSVALINTVSGVLMVAGTLGASGLVARAARRAPSHDAVPLGASALLMWFFFVNKVYSPQYSLWVMILGALVGAPSTLAAIFACSDVVFFVAIFAWLYLANVHDASAGWFWGQVLVPSMVAREAVIAALIAWIVRTLLRTPRDAIG